VALLELSGVQARYGAVEALHGVSLTVDEGEVVAVLGANGAGKTTMLRAVSGTVTSEGDRVLAGRPLAGRSPDAIARLGVAHVPEGRGTFAELSVLENLRLGAYARRNGLAEDLERVFGFWPWMRERQGQAAGSLSGGEQQMLALGRALMARPRLLLLDEPSLGLAPIVVRDVFSIVAELNEQGLTVLIAEQEAAAVLRLSNRAYVLEAGRVVLEGASEELARNEDVRRAYLGY
jgi:branched-chain amino acid transport system ATP-binding protein